MNEQGNQKQAEVVVDEACTKALEVPVGRDDVIEVDEVGSSVHPVDLLCRSHSLRVKGGIEGVHLAEEFAVMTDLPVGREPSQPRN